MAFVDITEEEESVVMWRISLEQYLVELRILLHYCLMLSGLSFSLFFLQ